MVLNLGQILVKVGDQVEVAFYEKDKYRSEEEDDGAESFSYYVFTID